MYEFLLSTAIVALAEMGDKTQLLALLLAARFRKPVPILVAILLATLINHGLSAVLGQWITTVIGPEVLLWIVSIGKNNHIFSHASIGTIPQDLKFNPNDDVELIIGDNNKIREYTLFNPGTITGHAKTVIGNNNLFMGYVHVAHDCVIGNNSIFANGVTLAGHVECGDFVVIGGL